MWRQLIALLFALSALGTTTVTVLSWRRRHTTTAVRSLVFVAAGIVVWSVADLLGVLADTPERALLFKAGIFPGVCLGAAATFCLFLAVTDRGWSLSRRTALLLAIEPAVTVTAAATNPWHHQLILDTVQVGPLGVPIPHYGPLFWLHAAYANIILASGAFRVVQAWRQAQRAHRRVLVVTLIAVVAPAVTNPVVLAFSDHIVDVTVVAFAISAAAVLWGLAHRWFTELVPVARQRVLDTIEDAVTVVDPAGLVLDLNPAAVRLARRLLADPPAVLVGRQVVEVFGDLPLAEAEYTITDVMGRGVDLNVRVSGLYDRRDGQLGWTLVARDITELNRRQRELERANDRLERANDQLREKLEIIELLRAHLAEQAVRDALTGLHNRRYLMDALADKVQDAAQGRTSFGVVLIDIDHFKQINDRYGHGVGDTVLCHVARLLTGAVHDDDIVARHGGEEFVLVLLGATPEQTRARADLLRDEVARAALDSDGHVIQVTFSAGVAGFTGRESPAELLQAADEALYTAKRRGRNRVEMALPAGSQPGAAV
jgi:diguanylate cyclase (GGDEF)-like protein